VDSQVVPPPIARGRTIARREWAGILTRCRDDVAGGVVTIGQRCRREGRGALRPREPADRVPERAGAHRQSDLGELGRRLGGDADDVPAGRALATAAVRWRRRGAAGLSRLAERLSLAARLGGASCRRGGGCRRGAARRRLPRGILRRPPTIRRPRTIRRLSSAWPGPRPALGRGGARPGPFGRGRRRGCRRTVRMPGGGRRRWAFLTPAMRPPTRQRAEDV
jgi:hypothetical protein